MTKRTRTNSAKQSPKKNQLFSREARILMLLAAPVLLGVVVLIAITANGNGASDNTSGGAAVVGSSGSGSATDSAARASRMIRDDSPVLGSPEAPVTIVEFLDPECESCRAAFPTIKRVVSEYEGNVKLVVRYFPLHKNSVLAAQATEAAGEQGKYWEMQELLFNNQQQWGEKNSPQTEVFINYASSLGLDVDRFRSSLQSSNYTAKVERDRQDGVALGVRGTPTIFINGQQVSDFRYATLKAAIDSALSRN